MPNMEEKLAAALLTMMRIDPATGSLKPIITFEESKKMTAKQIIARFSPNHFPKRHEAGGSNHPSNIEWLTREEHAARTAKYDQPQIGKIRRVKKAQQAHKKRMAKKSRRRAKSQWRSRPLLSRNTFQKHAGKTA